MDRTPYATDFLWHQIEIAYNEVRKPLYKNLLKQYIFDENLRKKIEKKKDYKGRNYEGGLLEATASLVSLTLCMYDNYPDLDIDLVLTSFIMNMFCSTYTKKECFEKIKKYPELVPFLFKKQRKKPSLELTFFDSLIKFDNKMFLKLQWKRKQVLKKLQRGK